MRLVGGALVLGIVAAYVAVNFYRDSVLHPRSVNVARDRTYWTLTARDDYNAVVRKMGAPASDRWLGLAGGKRYRALDYPARACTVVLMSADGGEATYIGALDAGWNPVHDVTVTGGGSSEALLRMLPRF